MDIGYKIKQLRLQKGLTLEELASRCELTKGFLSQLERNLTSPSISTLDDILEVLGSTLSDFFLEEKEEKVTFQGKDFYVDEREEYTVNWIVPNSQKNEMEPILLELLPGAKSFEVNPNDGEEFGYVLEGRITLVNGNNEYIDIIYARNPEVVLDENGTGNFTVGNGTISVYVEEKAAKKLFLSGYSSIQKICKLQKACANILLNISLKGVI